ncbi:MAG: 50S ribosome-binding GTPase [Deltaproteobacteria bacterium]|nr:50S ribosome-binding GTPase [Deltaproteobacteria bacterium]
MPANLPPQYFDAEKRFREAKTTSEKVAALEAMLAIMPHHKGTDKLRADLRRRLSKLRDEQEHKRGGSRAALFSVKREGAGQVALVGIPNAGKSQLVAALTNATPEVADYPFTTQKPQAGMAVFENVQIQLVDLPPLTVEHTEPWAFNIMRGADILLLVLDLSHDPVSELETIREILGGQRIILKGNAEEDAESGSYIKQWLMVGNKSDLPGTAENATIFKELYADRFTLTMISAKEGGQQVEALRGRLFSLLEVLRVYSKRPGHETDLNTPVILKQQSTVLDLAKEIHKDFFAKLQYARIWGSGKYDGQRVQRDYILQDGDIIELHM